MFKLDQTSAVKLIWLQDCYWLIKWGKKYLTHRKFKFQVLKQLLPVIDNSLPHLIVTRDVGVDKGFPEYHT